MRPKANPLSHMVQNQIDASVTIAPLTLAWTHSPLWPAKDQGPKTSRCPVKDAKVSEKDSNHAFIWIPDLVQRISEKSMDSVDHLLLPTLAILTVESSLTFPFNLSSVSIWFWGAQAVKYSCSSAGLHRVNAPLTQFPQYLHFQTRTLMRQHRQFSRGFAFASKHVAAVCLCY